MKLTGTGFHTYEVQDDWAILPEEMSRADIADVGVDGQDNVFLFSRSMHQVLVLDADGKFSHAWGDRDMFPRPHGVTVGPDGAIWLTDVADFTVRKCNAAGEVLLTLGRSGQSQPSFSGKPFGQCTHVAIDPDDECVFVTDGYTDGSVHKFTPDGRHLFSWGEAGTDPGQFSLPHNVATDRDGYVYVADRHNARVQVFTRRGKLEHIWYGMALPCGLHIDTVSGTQLAYLVEIGNMTHVVKSGYNVDPGWSSRAGLGHRVTIRTLDGSLVARLMNHGTGIEPGQMIGPHGISVDSHGNIYVAELAYGAAGLTDDLSVTLPTLRRLRRVGSD